MIDGGFLGPGGDAAEGGAQKKIRKHSERAPNECINQWLRGRTKASLHEWVVTMR